MGILCYDRSVLVVQSIFLPSSSPLYVSFRGQLSAHLLCLLHPVWGWGWGGGFTSPGAPHYVLLYQWFNCPWQVILFFCCSVWNIGYRVPFAPWGLSWTSCLLPAYFFSVRVWMSRSKPSLSQKSARLWITLKYLELLLRSVTSDDLLPLSWNCSSLQARSLWGEQQGGGGDGEMSRLNGQTGFCPDVGSEGRKSRKAMLVSNPISFRPLICYWMKS